MLKQEKAGRTPIMGFDRLKFGGGGGNRTRVRKQTHRTFYERSLF